MAPRVQRAQSPRQQVVAYYRQKIMDGELSDGDRLPPVREMVEEWGVSSATVVKALAQLQSEGLIRTAPSGTFVKAHEETAHTPRDRVFAMERTGRIYPTSEQARIVSAELTSAPSHVAAALGVEAGEPVIRRERITLYGDRPVALSVSWLPGDLAESVPELLQVERLPGGTAGQVREATGRAVSQGTDQLQARAADEHEAEALGLQAGDPVLSGTNTWSDSEDRVIEFGEFVLPPRRRIAYDYATE